MDKAGTVMRLTDGDASLDLRDPKGLIGVAERFKNAGDLAAAVRIVDFASWLAPTDPETLRGASGVLADARDYGRCADLMRKAIKVAPDDAEYRLHFAVILIELREYAHAREQLEAHFAIVPDSHLGWRNLSSVLAAQGDYEKAYEAGETAMRLNPANREYARHCAGLLIILQRVEDALKILRGLEAREANDAVVARLFSAAAEVAGDSDAALLYARKAFELAPDRLEYEQHLDHLETVRGTTRIVRDGRIAAGKNNRDRRPKRSMRYALGATGRIIMSLLIREARTRFGGTQLGYVWAIFEPVSHLALLAVVFSFMHTSGGAPIGNSLLVYYFTGVLPYILFTNTIMHVQAGLESNKSLMQIPVIKPIDVLTARAVLELLTEVTVAVIMFSIFAAFGLDAAPHDIARCAAAVLAVWLLGFGLGIFNCVMMHLMKSWDHVFASLTRALYFISGIFFSPLTMPPSILNVLKWNPLLQAIDLFRSGFYSFYEPYWLNVSYLFACAFSVFTIGLVMERALRRRVSHG